MIDHSRTKSLQMVDLRTQHQRISQEVEDAVQEVIGSAAFINGPAVRQFAESLGEYLESPFVIPCGNGTDALQIAMMGLGLEPGDEILVPAFTYVATAEVIALLGLRPVFVDVEADTFNINLEAAADKISEKTKAIVPVHLFGQCANMQGLIDLADAHDLHIIEDAAQSLGAEYIFPGGNRKKAGTIGTIGITSFFPSKNLGCYGDGGALFTHNPKIAGQLKSISNHGQSQKYHHDRVGVNSRLDSLQAAILKVKLRYLEEYCQRRNRAAQLYRQQLQQLEEIQLPECKPFSTHVYNQFTIRVSAEVRDDLRAFLKEQGIPTMLYYPKPLHLQKAYRIYGFQEDEFPVAESLCSEVLSLPMHTELEDYDISFICEQIKHFFYE